jgi:signal transduction histidine kinase
VGSSSDVDWESVIFIEYFCELICVLLNRYLDELKVYQLQERASHGWTTDLATVRGGLKNIDGISNYFERQINILSGHDAKLIENLKQMKEFNELLRTELHALTSVQNLMAHQLTNVQLNTPNHYIHSDIYLQKNCIQPFTDVLFPILRNDVHFFCESYGRKRARILYSGLRKWEREFLYIPELRISKGALSLAVRNVVENSIKYTPDNVIPEIDVDWRERPDDVVFTFADNGIGIEDHNASDLFRPGWRSEAAEALQLRGNGLGLSISRSVLRKFEAEIHFQGKNGARGAVFEIRVRKRRP